MLKNYYIHEKSLFISPDSFLYFFSKSIKVFLSCCPFAILTVGLFVDWILFELCFLLIISKAWSVSCFAFINFAKYDGSTFPPICSFLFTSLIFWVRFFWSFNLWKELLATLFSWPFPTGSKEFFSFEIALANARLLYKLTV